jgi:hypothetical protein
MVLFFLDETTIISFWRLLMSKFTSSVLSTIALATLSLGCTVTVGSLVITDKVTTPSMNPLQVAMVGQKNTNELALFLAKTVVTQNHDDFLAAFLAGWVSLPILTCEFGVYFIAMLILLAQTKKNAN